MSIVNVDIFERHIRSLGLFFPLDMLIVGPTGAGKSSTINALMNASVAKVGEGVEPETKRIQDYLLSKYVRIHDSAGLGDNTFADAKHGEQIGRELRRIFVSGGQKYYLFDLVLVVLDGSSRDLGTAYKLITETILKNIEPDRVMIAINQADLAMKGRGWLESECRPSAELEAFLASQAESFRARLHEATNLKISMPVSYSASRGYNIVGLVEHVANHLPKRRRFAG